MTISNFISQRDALDLLGREDVSFVDASWYLPAQGRDARKEYRSMRIPGAVYFDIDLIADPDTDLPHMLPDPQVFAQVISVLGISHDNLIVVYDGPGLFSAPRVWWTLKTMGAPDVRILENGFDHWKEEGLPVETGNPNPAKVKIFEAGFSSSNVASRATVETNMKSGDAVVIDARPAERFKGKAAEPRPGLRSGHIPGSVSLPFNQLIEDGKLMSPEKLDQKFKKLGIGKDTPVITTCGSGVTAAILSLALNESGRKNHSLYDGSWAEWGLPNGPKVNKNDG